MGEKGLMASPQKENGYTPIAHEILEKLSTQVISPDEWRVLLIIFRKTYGWDKKEDRIALSQFAAITGMKKQHISRALSKLVLRNMIYRVTQSGNQLPNQVTPMIITYGIQKDFEKWVGLPKQVTVTQSGKGGLPKQVKGGLPDQVTTKETNTKETNTKEKEDIPKGPAKPPYHEIVSYLNEKAGKRFSPNTPETIRHINARWNAGFRLDDFKAVIDNRCAKWKTDPKMVEFLRPQTLFGTKFESYLNDTRPSIFGMVSEKTARTMANMEMWEREHERQEKVQGDDDVDR
jgi:phage replication O-like protein O